MSIVLAIFFSLLGAVIVQGIGAFWYSKFLFGQYGQKASETTGKKAAEPQKDAKSTLQIPSLIAAFIFSLCLYLIAIIANETSFLISVLSPTLLVLMFAAPLAYSSYVRENRDRSLFYVHYGHMLLSVIIISALFSLIA